jgi:hypothetical protein
MTVMKLTVRRVLHVTVRTDALARTTDRPRSEGGPPVVAPDLDSAFDERRQPRRAGFRMPTHPASRCPTSTAGLEYDI